MKRSFIKSVLFVIMTLLAFCCFFFAVCDMKLITGLFFILTIWIGYVWSYMEDEDIRNRE